MSPFGWTSLFLLLIATQLCGGKYALRMAVSRYLALEGFHRVLETDFVVDNLLTDFKNCEWAMDQTIPSGAYVDPYQIEEYERSNIIPHNVQIIGSVDLEASQPNAGVLKLLVFFNKTNVKVNNKLNVKFPFHLRYHKAKSGGGSAVVKLSAPTLLARCNEVMNTDVVKAPCCYKCQNCDWNIIHPYKATDDIFLEVPVGNLDHKEFVTIVTLLMIIGGCFYVINPVSDIVKF